MQLRLCAYTSSTLLRHRTWLRAECVLRAHVDLLEFCSYAQSGLPLFSFSIGH